MAKSIEEFVKSEDPLSNDAFEFLLNYKEELLLVDYKLTFNPLDEREWLEITKDIMAFANTSGGYLIFGIRSGTYDKVGLESNIVAALTDTNNIQQKINRHVEPDIGLLRSKSYITDSKEFVAIFVPASIGKTHVISQDASFRFPSGKEKVILRHGTSYVRKSAGNHLVDSRDLDDIINRRIDQFRSSLLDKIARVVEAPQKSEVFIVSQDPLAEPHTKFIINNAPDAIPIKGMSFTVSPTTTEQEVAAWTALAKGNQQAVPPSTITWQWYEKRIAIKLSQEYKIQTAKFCLLTEVPAFFWLQACQSRMIKEMLSDAISRPCSPEHFCNILGVSAFLGKHFYEIMVKQLGEYAKRLGPKYQVYPEAGPRSLHPCALPRQRNLTRDQLTTGEQEKLEGELNQIASSVREQNIQQPDRKLRWRAHAIDCFLYAQDDQYAKPKSDAHESI
jgi:hypothetical protein